MSKILFTQEGYQKLQSDLKEITAKRPETLNALVRAREMGDLSENGAYKSAKYRLSQIDGEIRHLNYLISQAQIAKPTGNDHVQVGHTVVLRRLN